MTKQKDAGVPLYVQYGCGWSHPEGWLNFDGSPTLRYERLPLIGKLYTKNEVRFPEGVRFGDIVAGLPIPNNSVSGVYACHVLEHLAYDACLAALQNTFNMMAPRAIFRLVVPDLKSRADYYVSKASSQEVEASSQFLRHLHMGRKSDPKGLGAKVRTLFGNSEHKWMWDEASMRQALTTVGFADIRPCQMSDCDDAHFHPIENEARFFWSPDDDPGLKFAECAIEARKPL